MVVSWDSTTFVGNTELSVTLTHDDWTVQVEGPSQLELRVDTERGGDMVFAVEGAGTGVFYQQLFHMDMTLYFVAPAP
jgi:hypothetical protein